MPRKTDGILFELQPRPTKGDDGNPLLYAQPVVDHKYDLDDIDDFCNKYRHTSKGEMKRFFDLLEEVTAEECTSRIYHHQDLPNIQRTEKQDCPTLS